MRTVTVWRLTSPRNGCGCTARAQPSPQARPITQGGPGLTSSTWEEVPLLRRQVLACRSPAAPPPRAPGSLGPLADAPRPRGRGPAGQPRRLPAPLQPRSGDDREPDDVRHGAVDATAANETATGYLVGGQPVERQRLRREVGRREAHGQPRGPSPKFGVGMDGGPAGAPPPTGYDRASTNRIRPRLRRQFQRRTVVVAFGALQD